MITIWLPPWQNHPRMCVLSTLCGNVDKHSPFDWYIYIYITWTCCAYKCQNSTDQCWPSGGTVLTTKLHKYHYNDVIMGAMASQIISLTILYSTVYSGADKKNPSSASLAFVRGIHRWPVNSPHKGPVTREMLPVDDVIMFHEISSVTGDHESSVLSRWLHSEWLMRTVDVSWYFEC